MPLAWDCNRSVAILRGQRTENACTTFLNFCAQENCIKLLQNAKEKSIEIIRRHRDSLSYCPVMSICDKFKIKYKIYHSLSCEPIHLHYLSILTVVGLWFSFVQTLWTLFLCLETCFRISLKLRKFRRLGFEMNMKNADWRSLQI